ncbi:hypothetical protein [uncultured Dokdonia sp.]|uniref:hypothetical protein n=1 Tax=uncultured Dokdonia sp. TaxID=575653 RepID=UPI0026308EA4|nr:hypothetical protein [uncultured Dokdonia sp.]
MKKIIFLVLILMSSVSFSQEEDAGGDTFRNTLNLGQVANDQPATATFAISYIAPTSIDGSKYLYDDWKNVGVLETAKNKKYRISNLNYDVQKDVFVSKVSKDSVHEFSTVNFKKIVINNKNFKVVHKNDENGSIFMEVVGESKDVILLKDYKLTIRGGVFSPTTGQGNDEYVISYKYYLEKNGRITPMKFKKSELLKVFGSRADEIKTFAKKNKLSFKKDKDVKRLFLHYNNL